MTTTLIAPDAFEEDVEYTDIELYAPYAKQQEILDDERRFKLLPMGRRTGKDRVALHAALFGHGPIDPITGHRVRRGIMAGGDIVWLAPDNTQSSGIWEEEIEPRFGQLPPDVCKLNRTDRTVEFPGYGTLWFRSFENVHAVRGIGKRLFGVVINEAAWFDLEVAWRQVLRPTLMDRRGWALLMSTTNAGLDGNKKRRVPSFFNVLCDEVEQEKRSSTEWAMWEGDARDNPHISDDEFESLLAEYPLGSPMAEEEVYARRLPPGARYKAVPQFEREVHLIEPFVPPAHWPMFGSYDWGYAHYAVFIVYTTDEDGTIYVLDSIWMRERLPDEQAAEVRAKVPINRLEFIAAGHDVEAEHKARGGNIRTISEHFSDEGIELSLANIDRVQGLAAMQDAFAFRERGPNKTDIDPRTFICRTVGNMKLVEQIETMLTDEKDPRKPEIRNADPRTGEGGDDGFSSLRYGIASRSSRAPSRTDFPGGGAWSADTLAAEARRHQRDEQPDYSAYADADNLDALGVVPTGGMV